MLQNQSDKNKIFSRRLFFIIIFQLSLITVLIIRLLYLQIFKFTKYATLSEGNRLKSFIIPPLRGEIFDRNQKTIATNSSYYRILLAPTNKKKNELVLDRLSKIINIPKKKFYYYTKKISRRLSNGYILIYDNLSWEEIAKIEVNTPNLPGIYIETTQRRFYPFQMETAHLLGYVSAVNEVDVNKTKNILLSHPDFKIGKTGIEYSFEKELRGIAGLKYIESNAYGYTIRDVELPSSKPSIKGKNVSLTIDIDIQKYAYSLVRDLQASISLLDVDTGEILALISSPSYKANQFARGISEQSWQELINHPGKPMINKTISTQYPPGSTFKPIVALAALEEGYNPYKKIKCKGHTRLGRRKFHCWKEKGHGQMNLISAIEQSCNIYFYYLGREIGINKIIKMAQKLSLGSYSNIELPHEKAGLLPSKQWKKKLFGIPWVVGDTYNSAIGQGFIETTGLQLATYTARLATGKVITPKLIKDNDITDFSNLDIKTENLDIVKKALYGVVNKKKGTAYYKRIRKEGYEMSGKTGTSQVIAINHKNKKDEEDIEFQNRNHGLFIGYAPAHKPKYAISVIIEHGGSGSGSAAPIAKKILEKIQKID
jgi:penicillin-binding protein 2